MCPVKRDERGCFTVILTSALVLHQNHIRSIALIIYWHFSDIWHFNVMEHWRLFFFILRLVLNNLCTHTRNKRMENHKAKFTVKQTIVYVSLFPKAPDSASLKNNPKLQLSNCCFQKSAFSELSRWLV